MSHFLVAELASALFVPYASPGGKTEALAIATRASGRPVLTLDDPASAVLLAAGGVLMSPASIPELLALLDAAKLN